MLRRISGFTAALLAVTAAATAIDAQQPAPAANSVPPAAIGSMAPDFAITAATRYGLLKEQVRLSDLRGKTVVISFFPRARTRGCTAQLETYRDQYATLFNNGRNVVSIAISRDADTTLASWARDAEFPVLLGSDPNGAIHTLFGEFDRGQPDGRSVFVIDPQGRIAHYIQQFGPLAAQSYTALGEIIDKTSPPATTPGS